MSTLPQSPNSDPKLVLQIPVDIDSAGHFQDRQNHMYRFVADNHKKRDKTEGQTCGQSHETFTPPRASGEDRGADILQIYSDGRVYICLAHDEGVTFPQPHSQSLNLQYLETLQDQAAPTHPSQHFAAHRHNEEGWGQQAMTNYEPNRPYTPSASRALPPQLQDYDVSLYDNGAIVLSKTIDMNHGTREGFQHNSSGIFAPPPKDMPSIFADADGDGRLDTITPFSPEIQMGQEFLGQIEYATGPAICLVGGPKQVRKYDLDMNGDNVPDQVISVYKTRKDGTEVELERMAFLRRH